MEAINEDMLEAIHELQLDKADEGMLIEILFNERTHKSEEWSTDAVKAFQTLIDKLLKGGEK
jgi:hypothetical protein